MVGPYMYFEGTSDRICGQTRCEQRDTLVCSSGVKEHCLLLSECWLIQALLLPPPSFLIAPIRQRSGVTACESLWGLCGTA